MNNFRSSDSVPPTYQRAPHIGSFVEYYSSPRRGNHEPLRANMQDTSTCVGKHGPTPNYVGKVNIRRSESMLTNPSGIITLLATVSLVACGGGGARPTNLSSADITDSIQGLSAAADTVIHAGITSRNSN